MKVDSRDQINVGGRGRGQKWKGVGGIEGVEKEE